MIKRPVTQHDILKTTAIVLMVIDHVGFFLLPELQALRVIGRASAPIWFFLVGYNRKSTIDGHLLIAAIMMGTAAPLLTGNLLPINVLISIVLVRLTLPYFPLLMIPLRGFGRGALPGALMLALAVAAYPTHLLWEYGAFCWLFAAWGWWARENEDESSNFSKYGNGPAIWGGTAILLYALHYGSVMQLGLPLLALMVVMQGATFAWLARFHAGTAKTPVPVVCARILHFCGRQSLLLYVLHYVLLGLICQLVNRSLL